MTRNSFLKSIAVLAGVVVSEPLKLLKGKEKSPISKNTFPLTHIPEGDANKIAVSDGRGNITWEDFDKYANAAQQDLFNQKVRQYPLTEEECVDDNGMFDMMDKLFGDKPKMSTVRKGYTLYRS